VQCFCVQTGGTNFKVFTVVHFILEFTVRISVNMFTEVGTEIMFLFSPHNFIKKSAECKINWMLSSWRHWVLVGIDRNEAVVLSDESQWDSVCMLPIRLRVLLIQKQASISTLCWCSYCRMSLQKQYTIYCEGVYFLFERCGVSAPVRVNRVACIGMSTRSGSPI